MILSFLTKRRHAAVVERLHKEIVAAARQPALYSAPYAAPDTVDGRIDMIFLHAYLALSALQQKPAPGAAIAQVATDRVFAGLESALREMGVGDLAVPKRMKKLGEADNGRSAAYAAALARDDTALAAALARNVYGAADGSRATELCAYVRRTAASMAGADLAAFVDGPAPFLSAGAEGGR